MVTTLALALLMAPPPSNVGRVVATSGEVSLTRSQTATPIERGAYLLAGDVVKTGADGTVRMLMRDKSVLALPARSSIRISAYDVDAATRKRRARLTVIVGRLWALVTKTVNPDASYEVSTENAVAGVRGTELVFDANADGSSAVTVITGEVDLAAEGSRETLGAREQGVAGTGAIALKSTTEDAIAELREQVRPEQELDTAKADKRLAAAREKADDAPAGRELTDDQEVERDDPGTGDSVFEDSGATGERTGSFDNTDPTGAWFDPSTMARVRVRVEVRP